MVNVGNPMGHNKWHVLVSFSAATCLMSFILRSVHTPQVNQNSNWKATMLMVFTGINKKTVISNGYVGLTECQTASWNVQDLVRSSTGTGPSISQGQMSGWSLINYKITVNKKEKQACPKKGHPGWSVIDLTEINKKVRPLSTFFGYEIRWDSFTKQAKTAGISMRTRHERQMHADFEMK